ncbi:MAG: PepSY domain-containing protein [Opitutaceae bacterium]|nr:PepSY domain-containing protein [Opitutaceae bacterium]
MKRFLHLCHRWAGIVLCAFFAAWFFSGLFMIYVEYPALTRAERLAIAPELTFWRARLSPLGAANALRAVDFAVRGTPTRNVPLEIKDPAAPVENPAMRLAQILGRPAYVFTVGAAQPVVVFADTGEKLPRLSAAQAATVVAAFAPAARPRLLGTVQSDQWAVSAALNAHRPLHHFALDDAEGTELYVSSTTGEVVRDSTRRERILNYFGAVTHYLYPHVLRQFPEAWAWVVDVVAASGCVLALSGLWVGVLRARRRVPVPRTGQQRLIRWHYVTGSVFGIVTLTWVFSGWMSMNPGKLNPPRSPAAAPAKVLAGGTLTPAHFAPLPVLPVGTVEADPLLYDGQPLFLVTARDGRSSLVSARAGAAFRVPTAEALIARAPALLPASPLVEARLLTGYDNYYYSRNPQNGTAPLPVVRVRFGDAAATWFHLDPATGRILNQSTSTNRLFRHLYNGLHSFDWWWLWSRRPLWDVVVITFCLGGLSLSVLGVVLGSRRLRVEFSHPPTHG